MCSLDRITTGMNLNSSMNQESPPPTMDDGHTMSSDTSGPVCYSRYHLILIVLLLRCFCFLDWNTNG